MKILRIKKEKGKAPKAEFLKKNNEFSDVLNIGKDDVLKLLEIIYEEENIEFDENIDDLKNEAEKIIYENLLNNFKLFSDEKQVLHNELSDIDRNLNSKYGINTDSEIV